MSDFGEKFKKAFKIGGSSKEHTETGSPLATGAHGASTGTKVQCHPGGPLVVQRFRCSAQPKSSGDPAGDSAAIDITSMRAFLRFVW